MFSKIFDSSIGGSSTSSIQLRSKFMKTVQDPKVRHAVLVQCEEFINLSVYEVFLILMQTASNFSELVAFTQLEWAKLTDAQLKSVWSELRSQYNTAHHGIPEVELFFNCSEPYIEISNRVSSEHAMSVFKYIIMYLQAHAQSEHSRLVYLLSSVCERYQFGGLLELGFNYAQAQKFLPVVQSVANLTTGLLTNNCYLSAVDLVQNLCTETTPAANAMDENSKNNGGNEMTTTVEPAPIVMGCSCNESKPVFSFKTMCDLVDNYYLLSDTFECFAELRQLGIEPSFLIENEASFKEFIDSMECFYNGDKPQ